MLSDTEQKRLLQERDRLLEQYANASGEKRIRIIARLVVLDEELEVGKDESG